MLDKVITTSWNFNSFQLYISKDTQQINEE